MNRRNGPDSMPGAHTVGRISGIDLATSDVAAAKRFYGELFGWTFDDEGKCAVASARLGGLEVATIGLLPEHARTRGARPHWRSRITVDDLEALCGRVPGLGATLLATPSADRKGARAATVRDPTGAVIDLWQPEPGSSARRRDDPGCLCWSELATRDTDRAKAFWGGLLGWGFRSFPYSTDYLILDGEQPVGGVFDMSGRMPDSAPARWVVYIAADDTDACAASARALGAKVLVEPTTLPDGRLSVLQDPQGAHFAVMKLSHARR